MKTEDQIKFWEFLGWTNIQSDYSATIGCPPNIKHSYVEKLPTIDHNAIQSALENLTNRQIMWYYEKLCIAACKATYPLMPQDMVHITRATVEQKLKALLEVFE